METSDKLEFGHYLQRLREDRGLTQKEVAQILQVTKSYIGLIEAGQRRGQRVLRRLAEIYGINPDVLLARAGSLAEVAEPPEARTRLTSERVAWALRAALHDPDFVGSSPSDPTNLPLPIKGFLVELYQRQTERRLLTMAEALELSHLLERQHRIQRQMMNLCVHLHSDAVKLIVSQARHAFEMAGPRAARPYVQNALCLYLASSGLRNLDAVAAVATEGFESQFLSAKLNELNQDLVAAEIYPASVGATIGELLRYAFVAPHRSEDNVLTLLAEFEGLLGAMQ